jgi:hypothetical protein
VAYRSTISPFSFSIAAGRGGKVIRGALLGRRRMGCERCKVCDDEVRSLGTRVLRAGKAGLAIEILAGIFPGGVGSVVFDNQVSTSTSCRTL